MIHLKFLDPLYVYGLPLEDSRMRAHLWNSTRLSVILKRRNPLEGMERSLRFPLLQLAQYGCMAADPCTHKDTVFCKNVLTFGLLFRPQLIRCRPKKASSRSWQRCSVNTYLTPGIDVKEYLTSSTTDFTAQYACTSFMQSIPSFLG